MEQKWDFEIIVAEDGSYDATRKIVQNFCSNDNRIRIISSDIRLGKGKAITNAIIQGKKEYVGFMDSDLATDPSEFQRLLSYIIDYDIVIGSRIIRNNLPPIKGPIHRKLLSKLYSRLFRLLFGIQIFDPQCGFKLFKKKIIPILFREIHVSGFAFDTEVIVKAVNMGLRIKEVPIIWNHDPASKINVFYQIKEIGKDLFFIWYESYLVWEQRKFNKGYRTPSHKAKLLFHFISFYKTIKKIVSA